MDKNTPKFITEELLTRLKACKDSKDWWVRNNLEGFPTSRLHEIKGDYNNYISWLKNELYNSTFDSNGNRLTYKTSNGYWCKATYDSRSNQLTHEDSDGYWWEATYDSNGNQLTHEDADGFWWEATYDPKGNQLTYKDADGYWWKATYDSKGNRITFTNAEDLNWKMSFVEKDDFLISIEDNEEVLRIPIDWRSSC